MWRVRQGRRTGRGTIGGAFLALAVLGAFLLGYIAYSHSQAYQIGVARGHGPRQERLAAMTALFRRRDPENLVPLFVALLDDKDSAIGSKAAEYLGAMGAEAAVEPLIAALRKRGPADRTAFIEALGAIGDRRAVAPLAALLDGAGESEARSVGRALAKLGPEAVPVLVKRLSDPKPAVRAAAAAGLGWFALGPDGATRKDALGAAIAPLIPLLYDPVAEVRSSAADAMGNIHDPRFLASLMLALGDPDDAVREVMARVISSYGGAAMALLPSAFQSADVRIRLGAAAALADIAEAGARDPSRAAGSAVNAARGMLDEALRRNDLVAGAGAFGYYIRQGRPEAVPFLIAALQAGGHRRMADALLNCGLPALHDAAAAWAGAHGLPVETQSDPGEYRWGIANGE